MVINYHLKEIKYRLIYIVISLLLTYIIIISFYNQIILIFTPNIKSFIVFNNIIDGIILKWTVSLYISFFFVFPYILFSLWSFIRSGLFIYEDNKFINLLPIVFILPILLYFTVLSIYNNYVLIYITGNDILSLKEEGLIDINNISSLAEANINIADSKLEIYLPSLYQIVLFIKNLILFSIIFTIFFIFTIYFKLFNDIIYIKYRLYLWFISLFLFTFFLPPDLLILIGTIFVIITLLEIILFIIIVSKNYNLYIKSIHLHNL